MVGRSQQLLHISAFHADQRVTAKQVVEHRPARTPVPLGAARSPPRLDRERKLRRRIAGGPERPRKNQAEPLDEEGEGGRRRQDSGAPGEEALAMVGL